MLRCSVDVFVCVRAFVGYHQHLQMDTALRTIKQTNAPCSQLCHDLKRYFCTHFNLLEGRGSLIEHHDGMETLRVYLISARSADVVAHFRDAMYCILGSCEYVTPVRALDVHFPPSIIANLISRVFSSDVMDELIFWLVHFVERSGEYRTKIRVCFDESVIEGSFASMSMRHFHLLLALARLVHQVLQDYHFDLRVIYRHKSIGAAEVLTILRLPKDAILS